MYLTEQLQRRSFVEWNYLVRGLVQIWELAEFYGLERYLDERLRQDTDGSLSVWLGQIGNEMRVATLLRIGERLNKPRPELLLLQLLTLQPQDRHDRALIVDVLCPDAGARDSWLTLTPLTEAREAVAS